MEGIPLLLRAAEIAANRANQQVSNTIKLIEKQGAQTIFVNNLRTTTVEIEIAVVGIFSLFEARAQHHIPKGSFFKKLREKLVSADQPELAERLHQYYLAVNVLKHGFGASYEELRAAPKLPFALKQPEEYFFLEGDIAEPEGLININAEGFIDGLLATLEEVYLFLENH